MGKSNKTRPAWLRAVVLAGAVALFGVTVVQAQTGCRSDEPPTVSAESAASAAAAASGTSVAAATSTAAVPSSAVAAASGAPGATGSANPSDNPSEVPPQERDGTEGTFFPGSKSGPVHFPASKSGGVPVPQQLQPKPRNLPNQRNANPAVQQQAPGS